MKAARTVNYFIPVLNRTGMYVGFWKFCRGWRLQLLDQPISASICWSSVELVRGSAKMPEAYKQITDAFKVTATIFNLDNLSTYDNSERKRNKNHFLGPPSAIWHGTLRDFQRASGLLPQLDIECYWWMIAMPDGWSILFYRPSPAVEWTFATCQNIKCHWIQIPMRETYPGAASLDITFMLTPVHSACWPYIMGLCMLMVLMDVGN